MNKFVLTIFLMILMISQAFAQESKLVFYFDDRSATEELLNKETSKVLTFNAGGLDTENDVRVLSDNFYNYGAVNNVKIGKKNAKGFRKVKLELSDKFNMRLLNKFLATYYIEAEWIKE